MATARKKVDDVEADELEPVPDELVFASDPAAAAARKASPPVPFVLDGGRYTARRPKDAVLALVLAAAAPRAGIAEGVSAVLQFMDGCLRPVEADAIRDRMLDQDDDLDFEGLVDVALGLVKHWDARLHAEVLDAQREAAADAARAAAPNRAGRRAVKAAPRKATRSRAAR